MSIILNILLFILILGSIVLVHEFGHFIFAKFAGVYVYEFSIGMGPKLFSKKGKETEYSFRAIPIGGYCAMAGEDLDEDDEEKVPKDRRLQSKSAWKRFLIMFFGAGNNFIYAIVLLLILALTFGGTTMNPVITGVSKDSAALKAGIEAGDKVIELNGHKIKTSDDLQLYLAIANPEKKSEFVILRDGKDKKTIEFKPEKVKVDGKSGYRYGVEIRQEKTKGFGAAISYTFHKTGSMFKQMFVTVGELFTGGIKLNQLTGPVGIYNLVGEQSKAGLANILYLIAFLSINVGFINLLPLPAFDGGRIFFLLIEKIKGSPVSPELENKIHSIGLMLLMGLMVLITFNDIFRLIKG